MFSTETLKFCWSEGRRTTVSGVLVHLGNKTTTIMFTGPE